jgi:hypothetical protein
VVVQRLGVVILLLCVSVDFSNPLLPGSVRFDPTESIDAVRNGTVAPISIPSPLLTRHPHRPEGPPRPGTMPSGPTRLVSVARRRLLAVRPLRHQPDDRSTAFPADDH